MRRGAHDEVGGGGMRVRAIWDVAGWARAIAELEAPGPLPCRTVLVPNERVAHCLRRQLLESGHGAALTGTRFLGPIDAAREVLLTAGVAFHEGEEALRPLRVRRVLGGNLRFDYFDLGQLRQQPGWDAAIARTILDLEAAGLRTDELSRLAVRPRAKDLATVWAATEEAGGSSWTGPRMLLEAARVLEVDPRAWPFPGQILGQATGAVRAAEARFLRALPALTLALRCAWPPRKQVIDRARALLGDQAAAALEGSPAAPAGERELDLLRAHLFAPPEVLARSGRTRSQGPDGTVHLEEHAGVESEIEAVTAWVGEQVLDRQTPLAEIAVLCPSAGPVLQMVAERIGRLDAGGEQVPVFIEGGRAVDASAGGVRVLAVLRALGAHLALDAVATLLPAFRLASEGEAKHVSRADALALAYSLGTLGGSPDAPDEALAWPGCIERRIASLERRLAGSEEADDDPNVQRQREDDERMLRHLRDLAPALGAVSDVMRSVLAAETLERLWPRMRALLMDRVLLPSQGAPIPALLDAALGELLRDTATAALVGFAALETIEQTLAGLRQPTGRFGEPAVYVGTVAGADGLMFRAVRILGLSEGHLPAVPREDPVLPDDERQALGIPGLARAGDRPIAGLHALFRICQGATQRLVLSSPRVGLEGSTREPSIVLLEAAAALGRSTGAQGTPAKLFPDRPELELGAFLPARRAHLAVQVRAPLSQAAWQERSARGRRDVPASWLGTPALDLNAVGKLVASNRMGPMDGLLGDGVLTAVPGLAKERPLSASSLKLLLNCPHQFLYSYLLRWREPAEAPSLRELDVLTYGSLFHRVAERFARAHGEEVSKRARSLAHWLERAAALAEVAFEELMEDQPIHGEGPRAQQLDRLRRDVELFVRHEWDAKLRFHSAERRFGYAAPLQIGRKGERLFVRGSIDRLDVAAGRTVVRDLKTGKVHSREVEKVEVSLDLQVAVYGLVAEALSADWKTPKQVEVSYLYIDTRGRAVEPRAFIGEDYDELRDQGLDWLSIANRLLAAGAFPRTPDRDRCKYCAFKPVCGDDASARSMALLEGRDGVLGELRALHRPDVEAEDDS